MKVRAKKLCAYKGRRQPGEVFDFPLREGKKLPDFLEEVKDGTPVGKPDEPEQKAPEPVALSEIAPKSPGKEAETFSDLNKETEMTDPEAADFLK